ncbi:MAG: hypothetical protein WBN66_01775, partial [Smithella sp.]
TNSRAVAGSGRASRVRTFMATVCRQTANHDSAVIQIDPPFSRAFLSVDLLENKLVTTSAYQRS